jgi:hypothetical protein
MPFGRSVPLWLRHLALTVALLQAIGLGCSSGPSAHWDAVRGDAFGAPGGSVRVTALLARQADEPWLAVGWQADSRGVISPVGWSSPDGTRWSRDPIRPASFDGAGTGAVLAGEADLGAVRHGVVWSSADGRHWDRNDVAGSATLQQVVAVPGGLVALGLQADGAAAAWRSADGRSWRVAGRLPSAPGVTLTGAAADGSNAVAAGVADGRVRLWRSSDGGSSWRVLRPPGGLAAVGSAATVVVGADPGSVVVAVAGPSTPPALWRMS